MGISTAYVNATHKIVTTKTNKLDYKNSSELRFRAGKFKINNKTIRINPSDNLQKIVNKINKAKIPGIKKAELKPNGMKIICTTPKVKIDDNKNLVLLNLLQKRMIGCNNNQLIQFVKETRIEGTNDRVKIKFEFTSNPDEHKVNLDKLFAKEADPP
ncbi:MAG: hypothetical protein HRU35_08125, partial [Rickettsiaceae bacterium]|nr:hypothetical protein [Rickettsiaceae bacterium]